MKPRKSPPELLPLVLKHDGPFVAHRLRLFFEPTRTVLVDAFIGNGPLNGQPTVQPVKLAFELDLDPGGVKRGTTLTVGVHYQRSKPLLAQAIWLPAPAAASAGSPPTVPTTADKPLVDAPYTKSPVDLAKLRREQIKALEKGPRQQRKQYFLQLDIDTDPDLAGLNEKASSRARAAKLQLAVREIQPVLLERVQSRGRFGKLTAELPDPLVKPTFKASLTLVAKYMKDLIAEFKLDTAGDPLPELDPAGKRVPGLDATFEAFARGDLRMTTIIQAADGTAVEYALNGEPDSANYFLLAELAILACQADPACKLWPRLLRIFVRTQEIYCQAYAPQGAALQTWPDYTHKTWRGTGVPSREAVEDLRRKYETLGLEDLEIQATTNTQNAFCW